MSNKAICRKCKKPMTIESETKGRDMFGEYTIIRYKCECGWKASYAKR